MRGIDASVNFCRNSIFIDHHLYGFIPDCQGKYTTLVTKSIVLIVSWMFGMTVGHEQYIGTGTGRKLLTGNGLSNISILLRLQRDHLFGKLIRDICTIEKVKKNNQWIIWMIAVEWAGQQCIFLWFSKVRQANIASISDSAQRFATGNQCLHGRTDENQAQHRDFSQSIWNKL